jgi:zinc and cadmium transporter
MTLVYSILLFIVTVVGGLLPIIYSRWTDNKMNYLLTFSGAYLLSVTLLHLIPEAAAAIGFQMGAYMLAGFFLQQVLQRLTHGVEHGHSHVGHGHHHIPVLSLVLGMAVHAFGEGVPLGATYHDGSTIPALYIAIALHKLPEAMLIASLLIHNRNSKLKVFVMLSLFALLSPASSLLTHYYGLSIEGFKSVLPFIIAIVTGSFLHIGTTIFYESGNKLHAISWKKWTVTAAAIALAALTTLFSHGQDNHDHGAEDEHLHSHAH